MKTNKLKGIICLAAVAVAVSCTDGIGTGFDIANGRGKIALMTDVDASVKSSRASRTEYTDVTPDDLTLKLTSADGSISKTWESVSQFDPDFEFNVGVYTLEAFYGDENTEGFGCPYFYGSTQVKVEDGKTTPVSLTASLGNALVSVEYTENFTNYMTDWSAEIHSAGGQYFDYAKDETRPVYVMDGKIEVSVNFTKPNGNGAKMSVAEFEATAARHYRLKIDMEGGSGTVQQIVVTLDEELEDDERTIDISDEVLNSPAPEITAAGFTPGEAVSFVAGVPYDYSLNFNLIARGGLKEVKLTTNSASLQAQGWPAEIELMGASAAERQTLTDLGLGIRGLYNNPDQMAVLSFADVLGHIAYLSAGDNTATFTVEVKDQFSKVSEPVSLTAVASRLALGLENPELYVMGTQLTVDVRFNGGDPTGKVVMKYLLASQGVDRVFTPTFTKIAEGLYRATGKVNASADDLKLTASAPGVDDVTITVVRKPQVVPAPGTAANAFATFAYVPVTIGSQDDNASLVAEMMDGATIYVSTDGSTFAAATTEGDASNHVMKVSGLAPATSYTAKIRNGSQELDDVTPFTFETEAILGLPNSTMEDGGNGSNHNEKTIASWGTNNPMTTSQGANFDYAKISGTLIDGSGHTDKCALLRTIGWGSGNKIWLGSIEKSTIKYIDAGLLHLGSDRTVRPSTASSTPGSVDTSDLDCGIDFASRPSKLTFWYKYIPFNASDKGFAEIWLKDAQGNIIAQKTMDLPESTSFKQETLELPLTFNMDKAAKIYVRFQSTHDTQYLEQKNANLYYKIASMVYGSRLYIDDIELKY